MAGLKDSVLVHLMQLIEGLVAINDFIAFIQGDIRAWCAFDQALTQFIQMLPGRIHNIKLAMPVPAYNIVRMPELVEVEVFKRKIERSVRGKTITEVTVVPDDIVFRKKSPSSVKKTLLGARVKGCYRKGKYIWFELDRTPCPVFHLGMTGSYIVTEGPLDKNLKSVKLVLEMNDGTKLVFRDPRRFGRIFLVDDPLFSPPLSRLGPDVMNELPSVGELFELFQRRKAPIKGVLLDQSALSGIGNWMADEILFQSRIAPMRPAQKILLSEVKALRSKINQVVKLSVNVSADYDRYPKTWLFHHRWGRKVGKIKSGEKIKHNVVAGRATAWVPRLQK
jgi:formamidopyrimidine-DNA glycosylase